MKKFAVALALFALMAQGASAADGVYKLVVPRAPATDEDIALEIRTGVLPRDAEIDVLSGPVLLGTVSPFAVHGHAAGGYTVPLKGVTRRGARLSVRLVLTRFGEKPRPPTAREVRGVRLIYRHVSR